MENNSPVQTRRSELPLSYVLEGKSKTLTIMLQGTIAVWMAGLAFEGYGIFFDMDAGLFNFTKEANNFLSTDFAYYLFYLIVGCVSSALIFVASSMNFHPLNSMTWRRQTFYSILALLVIDLVAISHIVEILKILVGRFPDASERNKVYFLAIGIPSAAGTCFAVLANCIFVREFGCCICCCSQKIGDRFIRDVQSNWTSSRNIPEAQSNAIGDKIGKIENLAESVELGYLDASCSHGPSVVTCPEEQCQNTVGTEVINGIQGLVPNLIQRWNTRTLLELSSVHTKATDSSNQASTSIVESKASREEPVLNQSTSGEKRFRRSLRPVMSQTLVKFFQGGEQSVLSLFGFSRSSIRKLWLAVKEEPDRFEYVVWVKSAFVTSIAVLVYACLKSLSIIYSLVDQYTENRDRIINSMEKLDQYLNEAGWANGLDSVSRTTVIRLCLLADRIILDSKWTACIGYPIGTVFGLCSIITVLIQYKRMTLAMSRNLELMKSRITGIEQAKRQWMQFQDEYPMFHASMFLAVLSSTAVVQAQIVAVVISVLLGSIWNYKKLYFLFELSGPYVLAGILILIVDVIFMRLLKSSLTADQEYGIKHPRWFNFSIMVFSLVHLVLGLLHAMWRLVYLSATTVFVLNRLDVSLFTFGKSLDNGHISFMSMLVLTLLIQQDKIQCDTEVEVV
eukprot:g303.t1